MAFTLYRGAWQCDPRVPTYVGDPTDTKPTTDASGKTLPNGSVFKTTEGAKYTFDATGVQWYEGGIG